jgi:hypothetical protein
VGYGHLPNLLTLLCTSLDFLEKLSPLTSSLLSHTHTHTRIKVGCVAKSMLLHWLWNSNICLVLFVLARKLGVVAHRERRLRRRLRVELRQPPSSRLSSCANRRLSTCGNAACGSRSVRLCVRVCLLVSERLTRLLQPAYTCGNKTRITCMSGVALNMRP